MSGVLFCSHRFKQSNSSTKFVVFSTNDFNKALKIKSVCLFVYCPDCIVRYVVYRLVVFEWYNMCEVVGV